MKKLYAVSALLLGSLAASAELPGELSWSDYTGESFTANWSGSADGADITVFTLSGQTGDQSVTFADIIRNGRINMYAAASLEPMFQLSFKAGLGAVGEVDGTQGVMMSETDDAITITTPNGFIRNLVIRGHITGAEDTSDYALSPYLFINALEQDGSSTGFSFSTFAYQLSGSEEGQFGGEYDYGRFLNNYFKSLSAVKFYYVKNEGQVGDLVITSIDVTYEERGMLIDKQAVAGESFEVTGCNPGLPYFYYLSSKDGSEVTPIVTVDGFIAPTTLTADPTSSTSYKATWSEAYKASEVTVANYEVKTYNEAGTAYVYYDNFDKADKGSLEMPDMASSLDPYTEVSGWETYPYGGRIAEGMIGTAASRRPYPIQGGYLYSPAFDLSGNDGHYSIETRIYGTPGDEITVYRNNSHVNYQLITHVLTIGEDGWVEAKWDMTDGQNAPDGEVNQPINFESKGLCAFLLDYLYVSQEVEAGYRQYIPCGAVTVAASDYSYEFTDLKEGGNYAFRIQSLGYDLLGQPRNSEWSAYTPVTLMTSGINDVTGDVNSDASAPATYYTPDGRIVDSSARGLIIVRQGVKTYKVIR